MLGMLSMGGILSRLSQKFLLREAAFVHGAQLIASQFCFQFRVCCGDCFFHSAQVIGTDDQDIFYSTFFHSFSTES